MNAISLKGALHLHSTYSDGEFSLAELKQIFQAAGCDFACVTDHATDFDDQKARDYLAECQSLCDDSFTLIAGLEYECEHRMHVLGYGATTLISTTDPCEVFRHIADQSGVSVIAHPKADAFEWIESFETLPDGIEVWNSKYDGRFAPRVETFDLLQRLQQRRPDVRAFYGQDLHWKQQFRALFTIVQSESTARDDILKSLSRGDYQASKDDLELPSNGQLTASLTAQFAAQHARSQGRYRLLKRAKEWTSRVGVPIPAPIKAQLRRIF